MSGIDVSALLITATDRLAAAGIASPRVDAELLLAHCLGVTRSALITRTAVPGGAAAGFAGLIERRAAREPLQHIAGTAPFRYLELAVGPGVFIPRPETELLIDAVLPVLAAAAAPIAVDLCAGSGALALAIAHEAPHARVVAVEMSAQALIWLRRNAVGSRIEVVAGDVTDNDLLTDLCGAVDVVVSNPPYVPLTTAVDAEVLADPAEAVFAGVDGLALMPAVISRAAMLLGSGGVLAIEHNDSHGQTLPALLHAGADWTDIADHRDLAGRPRYVTAVRR
ncbi:MAG: peptide chain release factor N(5)-glutamine methyltransferase [Jatrophihabitantaceae bacterium]